MGLNKKILIGVIFLSFLVGLLSVKQQTLSNKNSKNQKTAVQPVPTVKPSTPSPKVQGAIDTKDPLINCQFKHNKPVQMKTSECSRSFECEMASNQWLIYTDRDKCKADQVQYSNNQQASNYPSCTIYYPALGYSQTYHVTPEICSYYKQRAATTYQAPDFPSFQVNPLPTVEPYQYSQEYLNSINNFNNVINEDYQPTQFVAPTSTCYATWNDYFNAHPNYASQNITGMSGTPPCD